ncbi:hypothetical protein [Rubritalea profundi]|uniref:Uncharacterized protein n=1 Tax=Rubritalea profundi TaxID=1658618 RepID=A0A2S7U5N3_9BACT|nr:hypothetical protein [Rubritalea profundi]PQJ30325.1 hypothetical protein BSZ32_09910 [Rubritalea profundi]
MLGLGGLALILRRRR